MANAEELSAVADAEPARRPGRGGIGAIAGRFRFSIASLLMLVITAAAASSLFAKVRQLGESAGLATWTYDPPSLMILAIVLTAVALGALKSHSACQMMLQVTLASLGYLSPIEYESRSRPPGVQT